MTTQVIFRLPNDTKAHELHSTHAPKIVADLRHIGQEAGYVFAPFSPTAQQPILLFQPETETSWVLPQAPTITFAFAHQAEAQQRSAYSKAFQQCLALLQNHQLEKIVLSRSCSLRFSQALTLTDLRSLFVKACAYYPNCFVALVRTPNAGTWLTATPEVLLEEEEEEEEIQEEKQGTATQEIRKREERKAQEEGEEGKEQRQEQKQGQGQEQEQEQEQQLDLPITASRWHTMALASTLTLNQGQTRNPQDWSAPHLKEQDIVSQYIAAQLHRLGITAHTHAVQAQTAGQLQHLCTKFSFAMPTNCCLGQLLAALHPTPAVCGLPTQAAHKALCQIEQHERSYYSGFSGPVRLSCGTHLFVTLRCMQIHPDGQNAQLYAGGGLLATSQEAQEWQETCYKLNSILRLL